MSDITIIRLPFPISLNGTYRAVKGKVLLSSEARAWKRLAQAEIAVQRIPAIEGPVSIEAYLTPPDKRRRDADNFLKLAIDALKEMRVIEDDNNRIVRSIFIHWLPSDKQNSGIEFHLRSCADDSWISIADALSNVVDQTAKDTQVAAE